MTRHLPDNWLGYRIARVICRVARWHTTGCRGRTDHIRDDGTVIDPGRWSS